MSPEPNRPFIRLSRFLFRVTYTLLGGAHVEGLELVPAEGAALLCPNHLSWADPPAIQLQLPRTCWFMANDFLFRIPILGKCLPQWGAFPVRRGAVDRQALREAEMHLRSGDLVCVFPEGGTSVTGRLVPFERGPATLALRCNVPVIPCVVLNTDRMLPMRPPYIPRYTPGGVTVRFGPLIRLEEIDPALSRKERIELLTRRMEEAVLAMLPERYHPLPGDEELVRAHRARLEEALRKDRAPAATETDSPR